MTSVQILQSRTHWYRLPITDTYTCTGLPAWVTCPGYGTCPDLTVKYTPVQVHKLGSLSRPSSQGYTCTDSPGRDMYLSIPSSQEHTCTDSPARDTCPFLLVKDTPVQILQLHQSRPSNQRYICTDPLAKDSLVQNFQSMRHLDRPAGTPVQILEPRIRLYRYSSSSQGDISTGPPDKETPVQILQLKIHLYRTSSQGYTCTDIPVKETSVQILQARIHLYRSSSQGHNHTDLSVKGTPDRSFSQVYICLGSLGKDTPLQIFQLWNIYTDPPVKNLPVQILKLRIHLYRSSNQETPVHRPSSRRHTCTSLPIKYAPTKNFRSRTHPYRPSGKGHNRAEFPVKGHTRTNLPVEETTVKTF
jgi:hypothetical protein